MRNHLMLGKMLAPTLGVLLAATFALPTQLRSQENEGSSSSIVVKQKKRGKTNHGSAPTVTLEVEFQGGVFFTVTQEEGKAVKISNSNSTIEVVPTITDDNQVSLAVFDSLADLSTKANGAKSSVTISELITPENIASLNVRTDDWRPTYFNRGQWNFSIRLLQARPEPTTQSQVWGPSSNHDEFDEADTGGGEIGVVGRSGSCCVTCGGYTVCGCSVSGICGSCCAGACCS